MPAVPTRRRHRLELAVFLLLVLPPIALGQMTSIAHQSFVVTAIATMSSDIALSALVLFFVWSDGEPLASIGWTRQRAGREALLGVVLYPPMLGVIAILEQLLRATGIETSSSPPSFLLPRSSAQIGLASLLVVVVACAEETIFRGYLLLRLRALTRSPAIAVVLASLVFASGHLYSGAGGVAAVAVMGVVFALVYLWRRSLVAPIVMHFLQDFLGLVVAPWLATQR